MTNSKLQRRRIKRALMIVLPIVAVLLAALFTSSSILFERSLLKPIAGAYSSAAKRPAKAASGVAQRPEAQPHRP